MLEQTDWWALALFVPSILLLFPIFIVPTVLLIVSSIVGEHGALYYYHELISSRLVFNTIVRSIEIAASVTVISLFIGLPYAAVTIRASSGLRMTLLAAVVATMFFSVIVRAFAWLALLSQGAIVPKFLHFIGLVSNDFSLANNRSGVIIGMVQYGIPYMTLTIYDVYRRIDPELGRAGAIFGANPFTCWRRITLPLLIPGIAAGSIIVFTVTLGYYVIPKILGSPQDLMVGQLISQQIGKVQNLGLSSALSCLMIVVAIAAFYFYQRAQKRLSNLPL